MDRYEIGRCFWMWLARFYEARARFGNAAAPADSHPLCFKSQDNGASKINALLFRCRPDCKMCFKCHLPTSVHTIVAAKSQSLFWMDGSHSLTGALGVTNGTHSIHDMATPPGSAMITIPQVFILPEHPIVLNYAWKQSKSHPCANSYSPS